MNSVRAIIWNNIDNACYDMIFQDMNGTNNYSSVDNNFRESKIILIGIWDFTMVGLMIDVDSMYEEE